jgi:hypothetical protein
MNIEDREIQQILYDFPKIELSYETMIHKKVYDADMLVAIPEGKKCFTWFTSYKEQNVCFILETTENKRITNIQIVLTSFNDTLAYGTILYGTMFKYNKNNCFCIEDLLHYKGQKYSNKSFLEKINMLKYILTNDISQMAITDKYIIFGIPLMSQDFNTLIKDIECLPYKIIQIKYRYFNNSKILYIKYFKPRATFNNNAIQIYNDQNYNKNATTVFTITPNIQNDIYNLFIYKNGKEEFYDIAYIPDYKTSVMMNTLFRNIKENSSLDKLEESDDEEEFENEKIDKFVYLNRSFKMNCHYNQKFKKWYPISLVFAVEEGWW